MSSCKWLKISTSGLLVVGSPQNRIPESQSLDGGGGEDKDGGLDGALSDLDDNGEWQGK